MLFLYQLAINLYFFIIDVFSKFNSKAKTFIQGRRDQQFEDIKSDGPIVWFHAASLGEFEQGLPVIKALKEKVPKLQVVLTFFSPSGYENTRNSLIDYKFYLPKDSRKNARNFIEKINPSVAVFIKYEFWFFYLTALKRAKIPTVFVASVFRENQWFFKWYGQFLSKVIKNIDWLYLQDTYSGKVLQKYRFNNFSVAGDTRVDRVMQIAKHPEKFQKIERFKNNERLMILGSVWPEDMSHLRSFVDDYMNRIKFLIAPHTMSEKFIGELLRFPGSKRYLDSGPVDHSRVLILDTVGMLSSAYRYADYAFIGGGFKGALHNILEPAAFGIPVFFGKHPKNNKFVEAAELVNNGGGFSVSSVDELKVKFDEMLGNRDLYRKSADASRYYITSSAGAAEIIAEGIINKL